MKDESEPLSADEWLIRRVHRDSFRTEKTPYISPKAFRPRTSGKDADVDGISMFRLACLSSADEVLELIADSDKRDAVGLVQVSVAEITDLGMSVNSTPIDKIRGHVSIPEMDFDAWTDENKRPRCKERMDKLAEITSEPGRILRDPKQPQ